MNVTFRDYTDKDKPALIELAKKLAFSGKALDPQKRIINSPGFVEKDIDDTLENVKKYQGKLLLAEENGKSIGYVIGVIWDQTEKNKLEIGPHMLGEVLDLYLDEEYRGQGLGTMMLNKMEDYFKAKGCDSMWIHLFAENHSAHEVYKKFGFQDRAIGMLKNI